MPQPDLAILALCQSMLSGSTASEQPFMINELCRRLILNGMTISASGTVTFGPFVFTPVVPFSIAGGGTNSGTALSGSSIMISNGTQIVQGAAGTTTTVLHGNAAGAPAYGPVVEGDITTADVTTGNVTSTKHGWAPKSPADATQFLNGAATPAFAAVKDSDLATTDVTGNNVASTKHGFAPKSPADATQYLNGAATPAYVNPFASLVDISGASAGQIKFPATQNPSANVNTLDDYEEGTWTPTLTGSSGVPTYITQKGSYVKIGKRVFWNLYIALSAVNTLTGAALKLSGLPFSSENTASQIYAFRVGYFTGLAASYASMGGYVDANATDALLYRVAAGGSNAVVALAGTDIAATEIIASGDYTAAA